MILKCLIVDDELPARKILENYLSKLSDVEITGSARNAIEAIDFLKKHPVDLIFLDINMPEINGLNMLKILQSPPQIILTTAYSQYALESYDHDVADYLLKPIRFERFVKAVEKVRRIKSSMALPRNEEMSYFEFKANNILQKISVDRILYLQSFGNYIRLVTADQKIMALLTTREAEVALLKDNFLRIHKSYIINLTKITRFTNEHVIINDIKLPVGKTYKKYFLERYAMLNN